MTTGLTNQLGWIKIRSFIFDLLSVLFIFCIPPLVHLVKFPLYFLDPMKILVILAIIHTTRKNAYFLAMALPAVSLIISGHPVFIKSFLISAELLVTLLIFNLLTDKYLKPYFSIFIAIISSKIFYYGTKYLLITAGMLDLNLFSTPFIYQAIVCLALTAYIFFFSRRVDPNYQL